MGYGQGKAVRPMWLRMTDSGDKQPRRVKLFLRCICRGGTLLLDAGA